MPGPSTLGVRYQAPEAGSSGSAETRERSQTDRAAGSLRRAVGATGPSGSVSLAGPAAHLSEVGPAAELEAEHQGTVGHRVRVLTLC